MSKSTQADRNKAVVIGASMAGLSAARVLADHFAEVLVLDSDELPDERSDRRGVPQGRHFHTLLAAGQQRLEAWFPGLRDSLVADGAVLISSTNDGYCYMGGSVRKRCESDMVWPACSRALLDYHVRKRVTALDNVTIRERTKVAGLTHTDDRARITGVTLSDGTEIAADLVIDAAGRTGRSVTWLKQLDYEPPRVDNVVVKIGYATCLVDRTDSDPADWKFALVGSDPPKRMGVAFPVEGDRWIVTLAGYHDDHASTKPDEFDAFARSLPVPAIADLLDQGGERTSVVTHKLPSSQWRRVEKLKRFPEGMIMLGDCILSLNPIYGQGMTSSILQADALRQTLEDKSGCADKAFIRTFYRRAAKPVGVLWQMATGGDFTVAGTTGPKPRGADLMNGLIQRYMKRIALAGQVSDRVNVHVLKVVNLL
ncbi:MAG: FAD-dependent monooxygenase, partial [Myxococcota bacterium]